MGTLEFETAYTVSGEEPKEESEEVFKELYQICKEEGTHISKQVVRKALQCDDTELATWIVENCNPQGTLLDPEPGEQPRVEEFQFILDKNIVTTESRYFERLLRPDSVDAWAESRADQADLQNRGKNK
eukprot:gene12704-3723_t